MIVHNGTQSSMLAGSLTGVLDNCFTVGEAGEREREREGEVWREGERERRRDKKAEGRELKIERENREWGHLSLLLIGYQAAHSLHPV